MTLNVTNQPFRYLGEFDTEFFLKQLNAVDWNDYTDRQENRFGMKDTYTIPIIWDLKMQAIRRWPIYDLFEQEIQKANEVLTDLLGPGVIHTCVLTKLPAGKQIDLHYDNGNFFRKSSRVHIPIVTNDETYFQVGDEVINMKVNQMWEICNHEMLHGTYNRGATDRIHLMIDWMY